MLFKFNHSDVMLHRTQPVTQRQSGGLHASRTIEKKHVKKLGVKPNDELLILCYTDDRSIILKKRARIEKTNSFAADWSLKKEQREWLDLSDNQPLNMWYTKLDHVTPPHEDPTTLKQEQLPNENNHINSDPTNGTWMFIGEKEMSHTPVSDGVDGSVSLRKTSPPYRQFLRIPENGSLRVMAELNGETREAEVNINDSDNKVTPAQGASFNFPIDKRKELGMEPNDTVRYFVDTTSIIETADKNYDQPPEPDITPKQNGDNSTTATETNPSQTPIPNTPNQIDAYHPIILMKDFQNNPELPVHYVLSDPEETSETACGTKIENYRPDDDLTTCDTVCKDCGDIIKGPLTEDILDTILNTHGPSNLSISSPYSIDDLLQIQQHFEK